MTVTIASMLAQLRAHSTRDSDRLRRSLKPTCEDPTSFSRDAILQSIPRAIRKTPVFPAISAISHCDFV
jgi:hypothetical protein